MGKFRQFLTVISARQARYSHFTVLFIYDLFLRKLEKLIKMELYSSL